MPSPSDSLWFSDAAYRGPDGDYSDAPPGWELVGKSDPSPNGYFGVAFQNRQTGEVVVANRGSRPSADGLKEDWLGSDPIILAQGGLGIPPAFNDANRFSQQIGQSFPGHPIQYTGHSLGGAEAQVQAANTPGSTAVTFGAPGAAFAVSAQSAKAASGSVINYVLPGDMVGEHGQHIGSVVVLAPTGATVVKDAVVVAVAVLVAPIPIIGPMLEVLVLALGLTAANHPLGNYADALSQLFGSAFGGGGGGSGGGGGGIPFVTMGATLQCTFGAAPSVLVVLPLNRTLLEGPPAANIMDHIPILNILPFGLCSSLANPAVAAATAAAMGVLTPMPCIPMTLSPWVPGAPTVLLGYQPTLDQTSKCMCTWAGVISITNPATTKTLIP